MIQVMADRAHGKQRATTGALLVLADRSSSSLA